MRRLRLSHLYDYPPDAVWVVATDLDCLKEATRGVLHFEGLPGGAIRRGQVIDVSVSLFGVLPAQPYRMELSEFDPANLCFVSNECGMGVEFWQHRLHVIPHSGGAELIEEVDIEAGWRTPVIAAWARFMYKRRHKPRLTMLARQPS